MKNVECRDHETALHTARARIRFTVTSFTTEKHEALKNLGSEEYLTKAIGGSPEAENVIF